MSETPWDRARAVAEATPTCDHCHAPKVPANLTRLPSGERWCPQCLFDAAQEQITQRCVAGDCHQLTLEEAPRRGVEEVRL